MDKQKFIEKFKEALEIEDRELSITDNFREYSEWDSLAFLSVIAMIDEEYDVIIKGDEFKTLKTLDDIAECISQKKN